jgi:hypothetical protein
MNGRAVIHQTAQHHSPEASNLQSHGLHSLQNVLCLPKHLNKGIYLPHEQAYSGSIHREKEFMAPLANSFGFPTVLAPQFENHWFR